MVPLNAFSSRKYLAVIHNQAVRVCELYELYLGTGNNPRSMPSWFGLCSIMGGSTRHGACMVRARRGDLAVQLDQAAATYALGIPYLGGLSLVRDTLELNYCSDLFHRTVHASSARSCNTRHYTNVVSYSLKIPPSKRSPGTRSRTMWGEVSQWPTIRSDPALVSAVYIALQIPRVRHQLHRTVEEISLKVRCVLYDLVVLFCAIPLRCGNCDMVLLLLLFACALKTTNNPHM